MQFSNTIPEIAGLWNNSCSTEYKELITCFEASGISEEIEM
jgi:hypothetical protein